MTEAASSRLPLAGIRVLDLSRLMAGNMLTLQLADFGAEVIKVESAQGDTLRDWKNDGKPLWWKVYGRNKKSICLDLKDKGDRDALLALVPQAQVVIESFRHGGMEAFGLGPERFHAVNPRGTAFALPPSPPLRNRCWEKDHAKLARWSARGAIASASRRRSRDGRADR